MKIKACVDADLRSRSAISFSFARTSFGRYTARVAFRPLLDLRLLRMCALVWGPRGPGPPTTRMADNRRQLDVACVGI